MAAEADSNVLVLNEFVSLPIIITDYDAVANTKRQTPPSASSDKTSTTASTVSTTINANGFAYAQQKWTTGFSDFADEMWDRMTTGMKVKLREACVEVLKRTDRSKEDDGMAWEYDDDARFLD